MNQPYQDELAQLYDVAVPDWPGEIDFYRRLIQGTPSAPPSVLEVACGTGRITVQLANDDIHIVGIDLSDEMLDMARSKSVDLSNVRWVLSNMRSFDLEENFGLAHHSRLFLPAITQRE
jgi:ubiquinone/menaquinone biosynthesis C-methylase UbiE